MPEALNVVALISGGKDSLFSLLHCLKNGHKVVALANLHPPGRPIASGELDVSSTSGEEDMNSFMYQTVGHQVIPLYADALDLPLYRREIAGVALQTGRYYNTSPDSHCVRDETEDLFRLLEDVLEAHPNVTAVSSGAILSTYQRTRVESVAIRLGLVPLAYLWQYPALPPPVERSDSLTGLLDDMGAAGCDARILKISSGGMKENLLWTNITDSRTRLRLVSGMAPFFVDHELWLRGAVLGEGGEYETLAIDGPHPVWKKRLHIDESGITWVSSEGGVHSARLRNVSLVEKHHDTDTMNSAALVRSPIVYDPQFEAVRSQVGVSSGDLNAKSAHASRRRDIGNWAPLSLPKTVPNSSQTRIILSNVVAEGLDGDAAAQMTDIVSQVKATLGSISPLITPSSTMSVLLLLSSMSDFAAINPVYASLFIQGEPNPPARVTVAADLPPDVKVSLSLVLHQRPQSQRRGLHVQSRSYWAPANIGPYSQAICEPVSRPDTDVNVHDAGQLEIVHLAGQIPLVPQSMEMFEGPVADQAVLSLQHLWRVAQERGVDLWPWGVAFLPSTNQAETHAEIASQIWTEAHKAPTTTADEDAATEEQEDVWFTHHNHFTSHDQSTTATPTGQHLHPLPNKAILNTPRSSTDRYAPPFLAAEVISLPRSAPIEWWSLGIANLPSSSSQAHSRTNSHTWGSIDTLVISEKNNATVFPHTCPRLSFTAIFIHAGNRPPEVPVPSVASLIHEIQSSSSSLSTSATETEPTVLQSLAFLSPRDPNQQLQATDLIPDFPPATPVIPCRSLWGSVMNHHDAGAEGMKEMQDLEAALLLVWQLS